MPTLPVHPPLQQGACFAITAGSRGARKGGTPPISVLMRLGTQSAPWALLLQEQCVWLSHHDTPSTQRCSWPSVEPFGSPLARHPTPCGSSRARHTEIFPETTISEASEPSCFQPPRPQKKAKTEETSEALVYSDGKYFRNVPHTSQCGQACSRQGHYIAYSELLI